MDLQSNLIESMKQKQKGGWRATVASIVVHGTLIAVIIILSTSATHKVNAEDKPIRAFVTQNAAPPPPPPPPPPAGSSAPKATSVKPVEVPKQTFVQPHEIPQEVPKVDPTPVADSGAADNNSNKAPSDGGVAGGVPGGVAGGVVGGQVGGVVGGQIGGVVGGVLGGEVGGTGNEAAPAKPDGPLRVGGDVKAPVVTHRVEPLYPDMARKGRIAGVVIIEAIIDKNGDVQDAKVLKGLPMGLSESAIEAVKQWHFKPGTMNGEPVEVIFDLTVNFKVDN